MTYSPVFQIGTNAKFELQLISGLSFNLDAQG
uniref:Uncharacterized protein n=1 Tax=Aegilops tauschii subsp. strangulata TaxID=200361 RepID=A0A453NPG1_AEGTS